LAYLARYTHRVAIGNSRLVALTDEHVSFRWKDYLGTLMPVCAAKSSGDMPGALRMDRA
jgi:hypothetical protein